MPARSVLVAYTTNSGSTESVARTVGEELGKEGAQVDVRRLEEVQTLDAYDAIVIGAPMILGWHRTARKFIKEHQQELKRKPVAYFMMAMSLTRTGETEVDGIPILLDEQLAKPPKKESRLSPRERYSTVSNYLLPVLKDAPSVKPIRVAVFGGKLELFRLKFFQMLFVVLIIRAQPADLRNWQVIRTWADALRPELLGE